MRIMIFSDHFRPEPSAPAAHVYERAKLWVDWGHDVTVVTSTPNFPEGRVYPGYRNRWRWIESMDGVRVVRVKTFIARNEGFFRRTLDYTSYMVSAPVMALGEPKPDVVLATSPHLFAAAAGWIFAVLRRVRWVMEVRDLWPASLLGTTGVRRGIGYRILERLELRLYRSARRIVAFTEAFRQDMIARGVDAAKVRVVVNGANVSLFRPRPRDATLALAHDLVGNVVGYLGTLGLAHGLENVLAAAERLKDISVTFLFVGVGAARDDLIAAAARAGLTNVRFVGRQVREDMPRWWSVCDIGLIHLRDSPVFQTVIPSKIFEAMAMGVPILYVGPVGEGSRIVEGQRAGLVVPPADPDALAGAVRRLVTDTDERTRLGAASLAAAPAFSRERQALECLRVIADAVRG